MTGVLERLAAALSDRYRIERELGQGGMATVYLAHDLKHDRQVAIKVMRADVAQALGADRFLREIHLAAKLSHPHILPLFDSGRTGGQADGRTEGFLFYVMPFVDGESLRDRLDHEKQLPVEEAVRITAEVADALDYAHRHAVIHRDIKPENIMLHEGHALVADFGIGKALSAAKDDAVTRTGTSVGTPAYMSPEQASGEPVDGRSDIYSLGCVLYEMLVGEQPFTGPTMQAVIAKRFVQTPVDVASLREGVPRPVARAVQKSMARAPVDRYETAARFVTSLGEIETVSRPAPPEKSLAVMPFVNRSGDADNQYFSDGLSEDLINALSALPGLQVASRTSAFRFRGSELDIRDIGEQLNVACVLEGSVRRAGTKLRVTAQLVNVSTGYQLWSERYDREMADVFEIQDEIVGSIVKALVPALMGAAAPAVRRSTDNLEAYELYLKGRHYWHQRTPASVKVAIQCFEQAIALDAEYALAYAGLADCYGILRVYGWMSAVEANPRAVAAAARAMALDPALPEANFSKAFATFYATRQWREAGPQFARALALNPRNPLSQGYCACFAAMVRQPAEVRGFLDRARELDPLSPFTHALAAAALYALGEFEPARQAAIRALELQSDFMLGLWVGGLALSGLGRHEEGLPLVERAVVLSRAPIFVGVLGLALARAGRTEDARRLLGELEDRASRGEYVPAFTKLAIHVGLDDLPAMRREFAASFEEITPTFSFRVTGGVFLDAYTGDPEIARLYRELYQEDNLWPVP